jgi:cyclopropane-fatty-acyl-phospholipid synthase
MIQKLFPKNIVFNNYSELPENTVNIVVKDNRFYSEVLLNGSMGLGESYMKNYWDSDNIPLFIESILKSDTPTN